MYDLSDQLKQKAPTASRVEKQNGDGDETLVDLLEDIVPQSEEEVQRLLDENRTKGQGE